jgi:hypothetical protein
MSDIDFEKYHGQKVIVQRNLSEPDASGNTLVEITGKAESSNVMGVLLKPKGRTQFELIPASEIESIEFAPEEAKKLKQKTIAVIDYGKARQHLVDRHGVALSEVNDMTEEKAFEYHKGLDHADLGHVHGDKPAKDEEQSE